MQNSDIGHDPLRIGALSPSDIDQILQLEQASWAPGLRADQNLLLKRLELGHIMMGAWVDGALKGMTSFSYTGFDPDRPDTLPQNFDTFSTLPVPATFNTVFGYNLDIHPEYRGGFLVRRLLQGALARAAGDGCRYLVGDGRCPSYAGSDNPPTEVVAANPQFRAVIDEYMRTGIFPSQGSLRQDATLNVFHRLMGVRFIAIIPDFLPSDTASGGFRVMYFKELDDA